MQHTTTLLRVLLASLLTLLGLGPTGAASAGPNVWTLMGPEGGNINVLAIDPFTPASLYAGTGGGDVFKSTDGGGSWARAAAGLPGDPVRALVIDPHAPATLYAGTMGGGVFKSTNGGGGWSPANTGLDVPDVIALVIDPELPTSLYAGARGGGVYKSLNGGGSWEAFNTGLTDFEILSMAIDPKTPATLYTGTMTGVFKSLNVGGNWGLINAGLTTPDVESLAIDPNTPTTLYAGTWHDNVFKSIDGGANWSPADAGLTVTDIFALAIDPDTPATIYAGTYNGVFKSLDAGDHWGTVHTGLPGTNNVHALAIHPFTPATLYAGTNGGGVFKSTNGGGNWGEANTGLTAVEVRSWRLTCRRRPSSMPARVPAASLGARMGGLPGARSIPAWPISRSRPSPSTRSAGCPLRRDILGGVFRSTNSGGNWGEANLGLTSPDIRALVIDPSTPDILYAGTRWRRCLQKPRWGSQLGSEDQCRPDRFRHPGPGDRPAYADDFLRCRRILSAACSRAQTAAEAGSRPTSA